MYTFKALLLAAVFSNCMASIEKCNFNAEYTKNHYQLMRQYVISEGWSPDVELVKEIGGVTDSYRDRRYIKNGWVELAACSGTGEGNCMFLFKRGEQKLKIITYNDPAMVKYVEVCENKHVA